MERITKASINGISFSMTDNAFHILDARLTELSRMGSGMGQYEKSIADFLISNGGRDNVINESLARRAVEQAGGPRKASQSSASNKEKNGGGCSNGCLRAMLITLLVILCFPLVIVVLALLIAAVCALFGVTIAGLGTTGVMAGVFGSLAGLGMGSAFGIKMLVLLLVLLPIACIIWALVILFSKDRTGKWKPLVMVFLIWLIAAILSAGLIGNSFRTVGATTSYTTSGGTGFNLNSDTLFIRLEPVERGENDGMLVYGNDDNFVLAYAPKLADGKKTKLSDLKSAIVYPALELESEWPGDTLKHVRISHREVYKTSKGSGRDEQEFMNSFSDTRNYRIEGDTLVLLPSKATFNDGFRLEGYEIRHPWNVKVVVTEPVPHDFESTTNYQNIFSRNFNLNILVKAIDELD